MQKKPRTDNKFGCRKQCDSLNNPLFIDISSIFTIIQIFNLHLSFFLFNLYKFIERFEKETYTPIAASQIVPYTDSIYLSQ
jgi:hypothetical protein